MGSDNKKSNSNGSSVQQIPPAVKKVIENLREIVKDDHCTDSEIYSVLRDCAMDPNEAVHKLLSQDSFHEVKSKRERRKEIKETQESRGQGKDNVVSRGVRFGEYTAGRSGSAQSRYNEIGKAGYKRENGSVAPSSLYSSTSTIYRPTGRIFSEEPLPHSYSFNSDNGRQTVGTGDSTSLSVQSSPGHQSSWVGATTGQVSMAGIVRMGQLQNKASQLSSEPPYTHEAAIAKSYYYHPKTPLVSEPLQQKMNQIPHSSLPSNSSEMIHESGIAANQHGFDDEWPLAEQQTAVSGSSVLDASASSDTEICSNQSYSSRDRTNLSRNYRSDEYQISERNVANDNVKSGSVGYASTSGGQRIVNSVGVVSPYYDISFNSSHVHMGKHREGIELHSSFPNHSVSLPNDVITALSSAAADLRQLNIGKESVVPPTEDNCSLLLPNNIQALAADCPQLNFGTYKSSLNSTSSVPLASNSLSGLSKDSGARVGSSAAHLDTRNSVYGEDEQLGFMYNTLDATNYNSRLSLLSELMKQDIPDAIHGCEYMSPSSIPDPKITNINSPNSGYSVKISPNARNLPPLPSELLSHENGIPCDMFSSAMQTLKMRDSERHVFALEGQPPLLPKQSVPTRYSNAVSTMYSPTVSMSEVLSSSAFSLAQQQPSSQILPGGSFATGLARTKQLSTHSNTQHSPSLGELGNMIGYSSMPESYGYTPALQFLYADNHGLHEPSKYNLPQHRSGTVSSLPLFNNANASNYGSLGNSANIPGNFMHNLPPATTGIAVGYDGFVLPQYKDRDNFSLLQQNKESAAWDYGPGSRTMPGFSNSAYYSLLGENQQLSGYQQHQHSSLHYGASGYPNTHESQIGRVLEHQQQSRRDLASVVSQGMPSQQFHQVWQHS
ncbi:DUF1296 domain-containing protein [Cephalotus follicularis]|uniref:DUF1296 domain-containing protein n=1 Tax=Cephalotus follicularis TaxID=3775 RepID=A0A1Q3BBJ5_CEPFO|nr:DUF1296 domain-containing protein [Cephalotus follicularis]